MDVMVVLGIVYIKMNKKINVTIQWNDANADNTVQIHQAYLRQMA